ncbi:MAG: hypothetical protein ACYDEN_01445 [Acidimicrobiales bacterium]
MPEAWEVMMRHQGDNPLIGHFHRHPGAEPRAWSDLVSLQSMRRTTLCNVAYKQIGVEDQLAAVLVGTGARVVGFTADRSRAGFTDREHAVMDLLLLQLSPIRRLLADGSRSGRWSRSWRRHAVLGRGCPGLLGGDLLGEDVYKDWTTLPRERLRRRRLELLDALAAHAEAQAVWPARPQRLRRDGPGVVPGLGGDGGQLKRW